MFRELIKPALATRLSNRVIPPTKRLVELLGIIVSDDQIRNVVCNSTGYRGNPQAMIVRYIAENLHHILWGASASFLLDAASLRNVAEKLSSPYKRTFYDDSIWSQECRYLVQHPIAANCDLSTLLQPLINLKLCYGQFPHAQELNVALLLAEIKCISIFCPSVKMDIATLLEQLIALNPFNLEIEIYSYLTNRMIFWEDL